MSRASDLERAENTVFDVAVVGGGINGASLYDRLCRNGYKAVLLDKGDFASGTSQASGMMIWGGLLYLRNFDLATVVGLSRSRDRIIGEMKDWVAPQSFGYMPADTGLLGATPVLAAMYLYWMLGRFSRRPPSISAFPDAGDFRSLKRNLLFFEEGLLRPSDSRFVLQWITRHREGVSVALNFADVQGGACHEKVWSLDVRDNLGDRDCVVRARVVVNCAGVWTDAINRQFDIASPIKHVFSKGAYLLLRGQIGQREPLIFPMAEHNDVITSIPWGPVEMWGPTEDLISELENGFQTSTQDVAFLLEQRQRWTNDQTGKSDIINLRCGVRPLPVPVDHVGGGYPLDLSRAAQITRADDLPWLSVYGGKLTGCVETANKVVRQLQNYLPVPEWSLKSPGQDTSPMPTTAFPELDAPVPAPAWCRDHEYCHDLESYLRRRTNIAQWSPRGGLGENDRNLSTLEALSLEFYDDDLLKARVAVANYQAKVRREFDDVLTRG